MKRFFYRMILFGFALSLLYCTQKIGDGEIGCRSGADCEDYLFCGSPDSCFNVECGACAVRSCKTDADCSASGLPESCKFCGPGRGVCRTTCVVDEQCDPGYACTDTGCAPKPCKAKSDCPGNFICTAEGCVHATCNSDLDCPGGYCIGGLCAEALGQCFYAD